MEHRLNRLGWTWTRRTEWRFVAAPAAIWIVECVAVDPRGDSPLNDDWSYGIAARTLVEEHRIQLTDFTSMPLVAQLLYGALFCLPFGFSFQALRVSTIVAGLVGVIATFTLLRESRPDAPSICFLATLLVACNPLYLGLANSFMTDVPFTAATTVALVYAARSMRTAHARDVRTAVGWLAVSALIRQLAMMTTAGVALAFAATRRRRLAFGAAAALGAVAAVTVGWRIILAHTSGVPALYDRPLADLWQNLAVGPTHAARHAVVVTAVMTLYLALFTAPMALLVGGEERQSRVRVVFEGLAAAALTAVMFWRGRVMPLWGDQLQTASIGPFFLRGAPPPPPSASVIWVVLTFISVWVAVAAARKGIVAAARAKRWIAASDAPTIIMCAAVVVFYGGILAIGVFLNRYRLPLLPAVLTLALATASRHPARSRQTLASSRSWPWGASRRPSRTTILRGTARAGRRLLTRRENGGWIAGRSTPGASTRGSPAMRGRALRHRWSGGIRHPMATFSASRA